MRRITYSSGKRILEKEARLLGKGLSSVLIPFPDPTEYMLPIRRRIGLKLHRLPGGRMGEAQPVRVQGRVGKRLE
jgi:hypothetical protein